MATERVRRRTSPAVYRRRRLMLLLGILLVAALVAWLFIAQPWRGTAAEGTAAAPTPSATPTAQGATEVPVPTDETPAAPPAPSPPPTPSSTPAASSTPSASSEASASSKPSAGPCVASEIEVVALTDKESYQAGENPQLSIQLTNRGTRDCTLNVGTTTQSFTVSSGADTWWRSTDCQTEPSDMVVLLTAGQTVASAAPLTWDRTRSTVESCQDPNRQRAPGAGSSYHVSVGIGGIPSIETKQFLLF
ncbi:hypothetical protein ACLQ2Q_08310 [Microbacterium sp. DT81.1]|uniref:hypothetical protein n=1 Tax=Microbacterium sp. DT81.1 TaxID=3393413 RepID=UPI003CFA40CB